MSSSAAPSVGTPGVVARRRGSDTEMLGVGAVRRLGLGAHLLLQRRHLGEQRLLLLRDLFRFVALAEVRGAHDRVGLHLGRACRRR